MHWAILSSHNFGSVPRIVPQEPFLLKDLGAIQKPATSDILQLRPPSRVGMSSHQLQSRLVNLRGDHGGLDAFSHKEDAFCSEPRTCPSVPPATACAATRQFDVARAIGAVSSSSWRRCRRRGYQGLSSSPGACMERL
ncbi:hypothetical protein V5799_005461 [Amblyomma americanum]|uniref:Uncharacterized protein n=1 Tax=Amblyomma americanum TaxID=6943 RepID=A0AAQ4DZ68_AMBAM